MSRSGYDDNYGDDNPWDLIRYRGAVASAIRGRRGQAFLREMLTALDSMPEKKLIADELEYDGAVCAIGSVGKCRGVDMHNVDAHDPHQVANVFEINEKLAREIVYINDEAWYGKPETPEQRYNRVREWILKNLKE